MNSQIVRSFPVFSTDNKSAANSNQRRCSARSKSIAPAATGILVRYNGQKRLHVPMWTGFRYESREFSSRFRERTGEVPSARLS